MNFGFSEASAYISGSKDPDMSHNYHCWAFTALLSAFLTLPAPQALGREAHSPEILNMDELAASNSHFSTNGEKSLNAFSVLCADPEACNYDPTAPVDPPAVSECTYPETGYDCEGNCLSDADGDGICDEFEGLACHDEAACNFEPYSGGTEVCLQIETVAIHQGEPGLEALEGYVTYNVYVLCPNSDDFVSSVSGDSDFPTYASGGAPFFQSEFGGALGQNLQTGLFGFLPLEEYDSYVTIGIAGSPQPGEGNVNSIDSNDNPWVENFENDGILAIDDAIGGAWFIFNGNTNGIAGDDYRVLLGQFTTMGNLEGQMYVQVFEHGNPAQESRSLLDFASACYGPETSFGCEYPEPEYDCNGDCIADADGDGVCDPFEVLGCTDAAACNFDASATDDDSSCTYAEAGYTCEGSCIADADGDGICDEFELAGCTDAEASNFEPWATDDDGSCYGSSCNDEAACNYTPWAGANGMCLAVETIAVHDGMVGTADLSGMATYRIYAVLDNADDFVSSVAGDSEFPTNINTSTEFFQAPQGVGLGSELMPSLFPIFPDLEYDSWVTIGLEGSAGAGEGPVNMINADGFDWLSAFEDGGNIAIEDAIGGAWFIFNGNTNGIAGEDHRVLLGQFTTSGVISGQLYIQTFANGDPNQVVYHTIDLSNPCVPIDFTDCSYPEPGLDCDGNCLNDSDGDGICDENEIPGCIDAMACNFDAAATDDDDSCVFAQTGYDCNGDCLTDTDGDGVCDPFEIAGCNEEGATNYDPLATDNDGSCVFPTLSITATVCNASPTEVRLTGPWWGWDPLGGPVAADNGDGTWTFTFDPAPTANMEYLLVVDGVQENLIQSMVEGGTCAPVTDYWSYANRLWEVGTGDVSGILYGTCATDCPVLGCTDEAACNFSGEATEDDGSCSYAEEGYDCNGDCLEDTDGDGICNPFEVVGCMNEAACNYDENATDEGDCVLPATGYDCNGECLSDTDGDGVCDVNEIPGCMDPEACNFNEDATDENGTCQYPFTPVVDCDGNCLEDADGDGICDPLEIAGCMQEGACNFDATATDDDGSCTFPNCVYDCDGNCNSDADGDGICDELEGQNLAPICGPGTVWNEAMGYCEITSDPCWRFDSNLDGHIQLQDLLDFLEVYGTYCN